MTALNNLSPIAVVGAGSWGTALALLLARNGNQVQLWGNESDEILLLKNQRENKKYLPGFLFPDNLHVCDTLSECLKGVQDILLVVPSFAFKSVLQDIQSELGDQVRIVWGTKGLGSDQGRLLHELVADVFSPNTPAAVLSGPSFAAEVAAQKPTAVSLAGNSEDFLEDLLNRFHCRDFRVYINADMIGVQLCSVLKNVLAIAVGIVDGMQLGANTRCALITRGLAEMSRLCAAMGGRKETLLSLAGVGDVILTCTDDQSRNRRFGLAVGRGQSIEAAMQSIGQAVEGKHNVTQVYQLAQRLSVDMPITEHVYQILERGAIPAEVIEALLERAHQYEN